MTRIAQCLCGKVKLTCEGEPDPVIMCCCRLCQRRTGAPVHIGAWFAIENVRFEGETKTYVRTDGDLGLEVTHNFCPTCGTTVWWPGIPGKIGIAGGCFADPDFPPPTVSVYEQTRHPWIEPLGDIPRFQKMSDDFMDSLGKD